MNLGSLECKDNNAAVVKRIMPEPFCGRTYRLVYDRINCPISTSQRSQKDLDNAPHWIIIIFTDWARGLQAAYGRPGHQAPDPPTTGNAEPAPESRTGRAVS